MAVSMNAGFMRSDFMISDAAIPMRMEELQELEQDAKFSDLLGGMTSTTPMDDSSNADVEAAAAKTEVTAEAAVITENTADTEELTITVSKAELKALAQTVVKGGLKLDELPDELVSDVLLEVIAMMLMGISEEEIPAMQQDCSVNVTRAELSVVAKFVKAEVVYNANVLIKPQPNAESTEESLTKLQDILMQLNAAVSEKKVEISEELMAEIESFVSKISALHDTNNVQQTAVNAPQAAEFMQGGTQQAAEPRQTAAPKAAQETSQAAKPQTVQSTAVKQVDISEEFGQLRKVVSEVTVKTTEVQQTAEAQTYTSAAQPIQDNAKGRVVVKSDELQMIKTAAQPAEKIAVEAGAQSETADNSSQPEMNFGEQTAQQASRVAGEMTAVAQNDSPVVFTRADGTEVEVRPSEVIEQVTTKIIEQNTTAEGDTEYTVKLTPEDLGTITVKLTKAADGALSVSIAADNSRTQRILEESGLALQQSLRHNGIELESWQTVAGSEQQQRAGDYQGSAKNPYNTEETRSEDSDSEDNSFAELISAM